MPTELHGIKEAEKFLRGLGFTTTKALSETINQIAIAGKEKGTEKITSELNLTTEYVNSKIDVIPSTGRKLIAKIRSQKKGLMLSHFGATQITNGGKRAGVNVRVKRNKQIKLSKAFLLKTKNKHNQPLVAIRKGKGKGNYKILFAPSASQALSTFETPIQESITDDFFTTFEQQLNKLIS
jgi:hypothetical protein